MTRTVALGFKTRSETTNDPMAANTETSMMMRTIYPEYEPNLGCELVDVCVNCQRIATIPNPTPLSLLVNTINEDERDDYRSLFSCCIDRNAGVELLRGVGSWRRSKRFLFRRAIVVDLVSFELAMARHFCAPGQFFNVDSANRSDCHVRSVLQKSATKMSKSRVM